MQFAGQRTDVDLKPLGKPDSFLIKLTPDILPDPEAVLIHGITPQKALAEGRTEAEALKYLTSQVFTPNTIVVGFNNIRFDDEFMRFMLWRNFYDAYEWQYRDGRGRWDMLDVARMTRALRPAGIEWPFAADGKPTVRLELLAAVNKLDHATAHDALNDVKASLAVARLIKNKQPKLFDYLLKMRDKAKVGALVGKGQPFVYTSGRYHSEFEKTTVAVFITLRTDRQAALVYDLRVDPDEFTGLTPKQLAALWQLRGPEAPYFPVKTLAYNRCPAVAPLSVLDAAAAARLHLDTQLVDVHHRKLKKATDFGDKLLSALETIEPFSQPELIANEQTVDSQLYDGFVNDADRQKMRVVRAADATALADLNLNFADERLAKLLPLYKARNYPDSLTKDESLWWQKFLTARLIENGRLQNYLGRISEIAKERQLSAGQKELLKRLKSYGEQAAPVG